MKPSAGVVIVGAGQAGFQVAASLRSAGYEEAVVLIGEEPGLPYQRPPLSKAFLAGKQEIEATLLRPAQFYRDHRIDLLMSETVQHVDPCDHQVQLASGTRIPYSHLVLATGARNRVLPVPGATLDGVFYLRTRDEAVSLRERLEDARDIVVIGGGFIGLEFAAVAQSLGKAVVVVECRERLMSRVVAPAISDFFRDTHTKHGVRFVFEATVERIVGDGHRVREVILQDGAILPADLVMVGIGVVPNTELAERCGLALGDGISVNENLRTNAENIYAIGDCAWHPNRYAGSRVRIESVQNAVDQAKCVAANIVGHDSGYDSAPWFWTDQYDVKLQMAGLSCGYDAVVTRGVPESRKFSVFYFRQNSLLAVDSINRPADHMAARRLLACRAPLTPEQAADTSFDTKSV